MLYLQSFQQPEVLKGSSLHDADLVVLQMTAAMHIQTQRKQQKGALIIKTPQIRSSEAKKQPRQK